MRNQEDTFEEAAIALEIIDDGNTEDDKTSDCGQRPKKIIEPPLSSVAADLPALTTLHKTPPSRRANKSIQINNGLIVKKRANRSCRLLRLILRRVRQRAFVILNPYVIPRIDPAVARLASGKMISLADASPVGALAQ
jgi:hypothetical protein